ncbi:hypothetical protein TSOC_000232 [Tetrabaena socialis]|uniref:Rhodanese domain-containing protein n=1 Tax=Tetrabaena socialis TaxID=47790 RepID=A0A2J8AJW8_9CHLO|nr:hypothetical protein TSOC_000232 [Tetrabaena socialis]|eukprot:PNH12809.1 hypothetical protein TSOC_000232 [Tetrabaena socialis]
MFMLAKLRTPSAPVARASRRSCPRGARVVATSASATPAATPGDVNRRDVLTSFLAAQVALRVGALGCAATLAVVPPGTAASAASAIPAISSEALAAMLLSKDPGLLLVDVRAPEEVWAGAIKGSINVPAPIFLKEDTADLDQAILERISKAKEVVIQCLLGRRAPSVAKTLQARMQALGIVPVPHISVLTGGIDAFMASYAGRNDLVSLPSGKWPRRA